MLASVREGSVAVPAFSVNTHQL